MPFAGYEDFDECVRKNKDKEDPKAYCAEIKRKTEKSVQSVDVFDESDTPAIDNLVDKFAKGGPGSGIKGHTTQKQKEVAKAKEAIKRGEEALKQAYSEMDSVGTNKIKATQLNNRIAQAKKVVDAGKKVLKEYAPKGSGKMNEKAKALFNEIKEDGDLDNAREQDIEDLQDAYRIDEKTATQLHDKIQSHSKQSEAQDLFDEIKGEGNLNDRREYDVEDLQDAYKIDKKIAKELYDKIQSVSKTPTIDLLIEKGGPGSGQKGHKTQRETQKDKAKKERIDFVINVTNKVKDGQYSDDQMKKMLVKARKMGLKGIPKDDSLNVQSSKQLAASLRQIGRDQYHAYMEVKSALSTPVIDTLIAKGGPGSGQKGHKTSDLRRHSQYTSSDYSALKKKGYTDKEISGIWDKDKKSGKKPLHRKEIPKMDESVKAKKISERLKSESISKTPAIDELIAKGGPGSGQKGHKTVHEKHQENRKDFISFMVKMKKRGMDNDDIVNMLSELKITKTPAIDALIAKGGVGSGVKGHTTAKELAIKKKFGELDKKRNEADALAEKDIVEGQQMINKAEKDSEAVFEETLKLGSEGTKVQFVEISKRREKIKQQEKAGWDLRIKGQNRKAEISDKYQAAAMKLMNLPKEPTRTSRKKTPKEDISPLAKDKIKRKMDKGMPKPLPKMDQGEALEYLRKKEEEGIRRKEESIGSKVISHEDSMIKVENTIKEIFPKYPLDYSGDLVTVSTLGNRDTLLSAYVPTSDRGIDPSIGEPSKKELNSYEDKWKPSMAKLQNALRIKGFRDMKVTLDYGEKGHIGLRVSGILEKAGDKSKPLSKQSRLKATRDKRQEELGLLRKEYHIIDTARRESWDKYFGEHPLSDPKSYGSNDPKDKEKTLKLGEDRDRVSKLIEEKSKQVKKAEEALAKDVDKQRAKAERTKSESKPHETVQDTLTQDVPKHTPKSNLLATKHAEAAIKRGTLFKELGKKSKKELKGMIQQDSKVDMAGSLKQMTKSDMKYHITSGKYPSPKGSEEAYNALTKQERKGLLKPIPDPKTPKAKGSEPLNVEMPHQLRPFK